MRFSGKLLNKKPKLTVIEGGKEEESSEFPKLKVNWEEPPVDDWLTPMTPTTVFIAVEKKSNNPICTEFTVLNHSENAVKLSAGGNDFWVRPIKFCQGMDLIDVIRRGYE